MSDKELSASVKELGDLLKLVVGGLTNLQADSAALKERLVALEAKPTPAPFAETPPVPAEADEPYPWKTAEPLWVEALENCLYPNPPSPQEPTGAYGIWRNKATSEKRGDVFRLAKRSHLNRHLREITADDAATVQVDQVVAIDKPQTAARGQRIAPLPV